MDIGESSQSRIDALIRLLGDENPEIYGTVREHLADFGEIAIPSLSQAALNAADARVRVRSRKILRQARREEVLREWSEECSRASIDLEQGAILISRTEYPNDTEEEITSELDDYAHILKRRIAGARTTEAAVHQMVKFLAQEIGFTGSGVNFDHPDSSCIHRVLESKAGLPILLASVYICVARRIGVPLHGVGLPQRFILKFRTATAERFIDPFDDGRSLTAGECRLLLDGSGIPFRNSHLRAISDEEILSRMLGNLMRVYQLSEDRKRLGRAVGMLRALEGE